MKKAVYLILFPLIAFISVAQNNLHPDTISNRLRQQANLFPNEKIHIHTDRSVYAGSDTIWFRAYLVNTINNQPETTSRYIYSELINPFGNVVSRVNIREDKDGLFYGYLPLEEDIPAGEYTIRAYTRYMINSGEEFFFRKPIYIVSPFSRSLTTTATFEGKPLQKQIKGLIGLTNDYHVDFLPEGGNLPAGVLSTMAFKALNTFGLSEDITGIVKDEAGKEISSFHTQHAGMGCFSWIPETGKKYYAECISKTGVEKRFELPAAETNISTLKVEESNDDYHIYILYSNGIATDETQTLLIHQRGFPLFVQPFRQTHRISIEKKAFSPGIIHLLLLSSQGKIISERQIFVKSDKQTTAHIQTDKETYTPREKVRLNITLQDAEGKPAQGNFSIAVTDNADVLPDSSYTIYTSLLLSSDLKGYIEDPGWYFCGDDNARKEGLDLLMLTQGWRKYNVDSALTADYKQPAILPETSQRITGSVKRLVGNKTIANAKVQIHVSTQRLLEEIHTGEDGRFKFDHFEFPDSTVYNIQATTSQNGKNVLLSLDPEAFPAIDQPWPFRKNRRAPSDSLLSDLPITVEFLNKINRKMTYENGMRNIFMEEVVVTAKKKVYKTPYESIPSILTLKEEDIKKTPMQDLPMYLQSRIPGLKFTSEGLIYSRAIKGSAPPPLRVILNGFPINDIQMAKITLETLPMKDIEQIDFNSEPTAGLAWFPMTGAYFIAITLKKDVPEPDYMPKNIQQVQLLGYQKPIAFYSPKYETPQQKNNGTPDLRTTIYWNPNIQTNRRGKTFVEFYTADGDSPYSVVIEGITQKGVFIRTKKEIITKI